MTTIHDSGPQELLAQPNYAVVSTHNEDESIHSTIVWISAEGDQVAVNSAVGRVWPTNLERDPRISIVVFEAGNPYHFVEIRGTATGSTDGADEHLSAQSWANCQVCQASWVTRSFPMSEGSSAGPPTTHPTLFVT